MSRPTLPRDRRTDRPVGSKERRKANWWMPGWLDRLLPRISLEESDKDEPGHGPAGLDGARTDPRRERALTM